MGNPASFFSPSLPTQLLFQEEIIMLCKYCHTSETGNTGYSLPTGGRGGCDGCVCVMIHTGSAKGHLL